jgi:hypothetical protein
MLIFTHTCCQSSSCFGLNVYLLFSQMKENFPQTGHVCWSCLMSLNQASVKSITVQSSWLDCLVSFCPQLDCN